MNTLLLMALLYGPYQARVINVIDGDTLLLNVAVWPGQVNRARIGVAGVDTPELHGACDSERLMAREARDFSRGFVGNRVRVDKLRQTKSGKLYAEISNTDGRPLAEALINAGYGVPFLRGRKHDWCP